MTATSVRREKRRARRNRMGITLTLQGWHPMRCFREAQGSYNYAITRGEEAVVFDTGGCAISSGLGGKNAWMMRYWGREYVECTWFQVPESQMMAMRKYLAEQGYAT